MKFIKYEDIDTRAGKFHRNKGDIEYACSICRIYTFGGPNSPSQAIFCKIMDFKGD